MKNFFKWLFSFAFYCKTCGRVKRETEDGSFCYVCDAMPPDEPKPTRRPTHPLNQFEEIEGKKFIVKIVNITF